MSKYERFIRWLEQAKPHVVLLPWQDSFSRAYLHEDAEMLLAAREPASGRTFISKLLREFKEQDD